MNKNINLSIEEKAKKFDEAISSKKGLNKFLMENWWDEKMKWIGMSDLEFPCDVDTSNMKVDGNLIQNFQTAKIICQGHQKAYILDQSHQTANILSQDSQKVSDDFYDYKLKSDERWKNCCNDYVVRVKKTKKTIKGERK